MNIVSAVRCFVAAVVLLVLGTTPFLAGPAGAQGAATVIRIGTGPNDSSLPILYAEKSGLFKRAGLNVEIIQTATTSVMAAAIASGNIEMGQASGLGAIQIIARGIPLTLIGATSYYNSDKPNEGLLVLASSPYKTAKDLEGQTMASVALQNMNSIATLMWLSARGVDVSTIKSIEVPVSASLAALEQNRIAATQVYEPFYSAFIATGKVRVLGHPYGAVGKRYADALLMADSKWATDNAAVVGRFLRVLQEASAYVTRHETETAPLLVQFAGLDPNGNLNVHHSDRGVTLVPGDVQPLIDAGYKFKAIPKMLRAEDLICTCALRR